MISIAENPVFKAQTFIRINYEVSAVSLREIRRFLFNFFQNFLRKKYSKFENSSFFKQENEIFKVAINLGVYLCYYIRLFQKHLRQKFIEEIKSCFGNNFYFEKVPKML